MPFSQQGFRRGVPPSPASPGRAPAPPSAAGRPWLSAGRPWVARRAAPGALSRLARAAGLGALGFALGACELGANFGDLGEQLLDPDVQGIDAPGRRWVAGPHFDLNILEDERSKRYGAARNTDSELVLIDFEEEHFCRAGEVLRYIGAISARSRPALVPILIGRERADGAPPDLLLTFTNFDCQRTSFSVPVGALPSSVVEGLPSGSGTALIARTPEGGLTLIDPWEQTSRPLAESVRAEDPGNAFGHFLWVDRGVITISNGDLEPVGFVGQNVVALATSPEDGQLAYVEAGTGGTGGTLYTVDALANTTPVQIATDVCDMGYLTLEGRRHLYYISPCAERQLVLRDVRNESLRIIDRNVAGDPAVRNLAGQAALIYVTTESREATEGTLWLVNGAAPKVAIAEDTRVGPSTVSGDGLLALLDWASTGGRLVEWRPDSTTEVARGVIEIGPMGRLANNDLTLLGNFDGETGDLLRMRADLTTEVLAQRVPRRAASNDAFLANFEGDVGDLMLLDRSDGTSLPLATGVARGAFIFTQQFNSILMLAERETVTRTNTLRIHLLRASREYVLHDGVTEAREVAFPSPGILYNVVVGEDTGVWFAKTL